MRTDRIYIARDGKSGMHVLVRILAVGDIGADYLPIDPDGFNELMMARDARSLVLAAKGLGPMLASEGDLAGRIFVPSELQRSIAGEMDLVPSDLGGLLSECYFDPYAEPIGTGGMGYRKSVGRERRPQETLSKGSTSPMPETYPTSIRSFAPSSSRCTTGSLRGTCSR